MIFRLGPTGFKAENWLPLARRIEVRQKWPVPLDPEHFFPTIRGLMDQGLAEVWTTGRSLLGALFVKDTFSGCQSGLVLFWWADGENATPLLEHFEAEAKKRECRQLHVASFGNVREKAMKRYYRMKGYGVLETVMLKLKW